MAILSTLPDKIGSQRSLQRRMPIVADVQFANHPSHVTSKRPHRLHSLLVLSDLPRSLTIRHIPILRADNGHVQNREVLVQAVEGCRGSTSAAYHHTGTRLEFQFISQGIEYTVEQGTERTVRAAIINGRADTQSVDAILHSSPYLIIQVIVERTPCAVPSTHATGNTTLNGLFADADDLSLDTLAVQGL